MINYPVIVVSRIHDHEPYRSIFTDYFRLTDLSPRFLRFVSWKSSWSPFVTAPWKKKRSSKSTRALKRGSVSFRLLRFPARPIPPIHPSELFLEKKVSNFRKLYPSWDTSNSLNYLRKDELKNNLDLVFSFRTRNKTKIQIGIADSIYKVERSIEFVIITRENKIPITNNCGREKFESAAEWVFLDRTIGFSSLLPDWKWNWTKLYTRRSTKKQDTPWLFHSRGTTA